MGQLLVFNGQVIQLDGNPIEGPTPDLSFFSFITEASSNDFDPVFAVSSGTLEIDLGDGSIINSNGFSHTYSQIGEKTVRVLDGTTSGASSVTGITMDSDNLVGDLDLSEFTNCSLFSIYSNPKVTGVINPISSTSITNYNLGISDLTGTIDLSGMTGLGGIFSVAANPNLTEIIHPDTSENFSVYFAFGTGVSTLDLSPLTGLGGNIQLQSCPSLYQITNPVSSQVFTYYKVYSCNLTGTLDVSSLSGLGGTFEAYDNPNLTKILNPNSSQPFTYYYAYSCDLSGTLDLSGLTGLGGRINLNSNPNLSQIINPVSSEIFYSYSVASSGLIGVIDISGLTNLGGYLSFDNDSSLTGILNPSSSRSFTDYRVSTCDLTGTLDLSGLTGLGGRIYLHDNPNLTEVINPTSSTAVSSYRIQNCGLTSIDISSLTFTSGEFYVYNNPITEINNPSTGYIPQYWAYDTSLSGTLDFKNMSLNTIKVYNNPDLTDIIFPPSNSVVVVASIYNNDLTGVLDCSGLIKLHSAFRAYGNSNLTGISFPVDTSINSLTTFEVYNCDLTGTFDISTFIGWGEYSSGMNFRAYGNSNLTELLLPDFTGPTTILDVNDCSLLQPSVDNIFDKLNTFYTSNSPTGSLTVNTSGGTNSIPTDGSSNSDILNLESIFSGAGQSLTITINT